MLVLGVSRYKLYYQHFCKNRVNISTFRPKSQRRYRYIHCWDLLAGTVKTIESKCPQQEQKIPASRNQTGQNHGAFSQ
jgi:hypothetical protein